ncbi:MAG: hypothetical protein AMJ78_02565 [Omnitrophica WOR_2 bacterium SM23_29]|nr:MAG: hypothetical protein AMJ78_02565 [Omnitrophica WOR_2 bacterium SM23_29]
MKIFPFKGIGKKNLKAFSFGAMLNDTGEEMYAPYLPFFAKTFLGAGPLQYGLIESSAEAINRILRAVTGAIADRIGRKKPVILGYILIATSRIFLAMATFWICLIPVRMLRQIGRSLRDPAREASITDSIEPQMRGKAFGLLEAVDTIGSALGPILGLIILSLVTFGALNFKKQFSEVSYRWLFVFAAIPTLISSFIIFKGVEETLTAKAAKGSEVKRFFDGFKLYFKNKDLVVITVANCLLAVSATTVQMMQFYVYTLPKGTVLVGGLVFVLYSISHFLAAYPGGILADKYGKSNALSFAIILVIISLAGLAFIPNALWAVVPFIIYGIFDSIWIASRRAIVADLAPSDARAQTLGSFSFIYGMASMISPFLFGALAQHLSFKFAFLICAGVATTSLGVLKIFYKGR